jgi:hypothetical protein
MIFCARATRDLGRLSLKTRSGRSSIQPSTKKVGQAHRRLVWRLLWEERYGIEEDIIACTKLLTTLAAIFKHRMRRRKEQLQPAYLSKPLLTPFPRGQFIIERGFLLAVGVEQARVRPSELFPH